LAALDPFADDRRLLRTAAQEAGRLIRNAFGKPMVVRDKGEAGPVTDTDVAVDALLHEALLSARPDYGWLSEESPDTPDRLERSRVFIVDPIDGTRAFIKGVPECVVAVGLAEGDRAVAGVVYNPITEELYEGGPGAGAWLNGTPIRVSDADAIEGALLLGKQAFFDAPHWPAPWTGIESIWKHSIAYRLAHVASGVADGGAMLGFKWEWDIAAGVAIVAGAGGVVSDPWGHSVRFNQTDPRAPGVVAAGEALHPLLVERVSHTAHPRNWPR
jgi:myo-inositol-1(or 4)-monophosphatase